jgi:pimeloyl-ACP methyl ester carboxylesterase
VGRAKRAALAEGVTRHGARFAAEAMVPTLFGPGAPAELKERWRGIIAGTSRDGVVAAAGALAHRPDATATAGTINVPAVVVVGAEDVVTPPELMAQVAAGIPGARLEVVSGAGHVVPVERPKGFAGLVAGLVERVRAARASGLGPGATV